MVRERNPSRLFNKVTIVGVGLMGGSLGLAIKKRGMAREVVGRVRRRQTLVRAKALGAIDSGTLSLAQDGAGYIWVGSEGGLYRYDGTRFRLMAAAEGLPCATEVHALHMAADGALWANTCALIFRFDGQRFHPIAGLRGMMSGTQGMANGGSGHVAVATPSGLYDAKPDGAGSYSASLYPLGPELAGVPMRLGRRGTGNGAPCRK